ncbi:MAG: flagellar biosynthetic protein FliR [Methylophilales bacterium RIFCSPHIGHO2_02_FULL_57_10]|nr:MAG: flagellar biosynthetic protein FliR [Methylophilales bacterium RIFCSPHIGHO2_02_FULL_57_10]
MLTFTSIQLDAWLAAFFWPFFRILALVASAPLFGARGVPVSVKVSLAFLLTVVVAPLLPAMPNLVPASASGMLVLIQQLMIGYGMGLTMRLAFVAVEMAGHIIGLQMGLGFATFFDPQNSSQVPIMGQFLSVMGMLLFLAFNGHLMVIAALVESFNTLPVGFFEATMSWKTLVLAGSNIFSWGLLLSLPVLAALMMVNIALAVLTRAAPQLNIFAVGFPITLAIGFIVLALSLPYFLPLFSGMVEHSVQLILKLATPGV